MTFLDEAFNSLPKRRPLSVKEAVAVGLRELERRIDRDAANHVEGRK